MPCIAQSQEFVHLEAADAESSSFGDFGDFNSNQCITVETSPVETKVELNVSDKSEEKPKV